MAHCKHVQATDSYVARFQPEVLTLDLDWKLTKDNKTFSCKGDTDILCSGSILFDEMGRASNRSEILELFSPSLDFKIRCKSTCAIKDFPVQTQPRNPTFCTFCKKLCDRPGEGSSEKNCCW